MNIGFIGTGDIAAAMIHGLMASDLDIQSICISPRNVEMAASLATLYEKVNIAADNQGVIDASDHIFICLRAQIAEDVLRNLRFSAGKQVISVLPTATAAEVESWISQPVYRAVPLPFVAECKMVTPIYPDDPFLKTMFDALGGALVVQDESQFNLFMTAGSFMGVYYRFIETTSQWLEQKGMDKAIANLYLSQLYANLSDEMRKQEKPDFKKLEREYSTQGGTNELIANVFGNEGGEKILKEAIEAGYKKISG